VAAEPDAGALGVLVRERPAARPEAVERFWSETVERFESAAAGRLVERELVIAGVPFRLSFAGRAMHDVLFPAFEHLAPHEGREPERRVLVWDAASTGVPGPTPIWSEDDIGPLEEVMSMTDGPVRALADRHSRTLLAYDTRSRTLVRHSSDAALTPWHERAAPLRSGLHWLLSGPRRHLIHGAAVGEGGRGLLIAAPSGSGKSTLAVACFKAGLDVAADDFVIVTGDGGLRAHSIYATAKLDRASVGLVGAGPELVTNPGFADHEKAVVDLRAGPIARELPISAVVVPRITGTAAPTLERIGRAEALRQIGPSSIVVMPRPRGPAFATAAELARSVPAWQLELGGDLVAAVERLRELLAEEAPA
jgi:hypothetical protein